MRLSRTLSVLLFPLLSSATFALQACGDDYDAKAPAEANDAGTNEGGSVSIPPGKIDVLLVVDDSANMADKASIFAGSIATLLRDLAPAGDLHVGVLSTSLGTGGDVCPASDEKNRLARLRTTGEGGAPVSGAESGVLSYTAGGDVEALIASTQSLVRGLGESGCGFEAQLESAYRFLVQPDPWKTITINAQQQADLGSEVDEELLLQRKAFLRPDSTLVVVLLTDEDDASVDPLAIDGRGWAFADRRFPGSNVVRTGGDAEGTTAASGTSVCATNPASPACTSCGFQETCDPSQPSCEAIKNDPNCKVSPVEQQGPGYNGFYGPDDDALNVRFHKMKQRFGLDPQFPLSRYVDGFSKPRVPDQAAEHPKTDNGDGTKTIEPYAGTPSCTNPIFAAEIRTKKSDDLCNLPPGPRTADRVIFAVIGGVPEPLVAGTPDWDKIVGRNPDAFDDTGIDPHMIPSVEPRAGLPPPSSTPGDNGTDPIHGREWDTKKRDLQYACTFPLPAPKECTESTLSCDCIPSAGTHPPLCASPSQQTRGKAYPTLRPLRVARALGDQAVVGSICATSHESTLKALAQRLATRLGS